MVIIDVATPLLKYTLNYWNSVVQVVLHLRIMLAFYRNVFITYIRKINGTALTEMHTHHKQHSRKYLKIHNWRQQPLWNLHESTEMLQIIFLTLLSMPPYLPELGLNVELPTL